MRPDVVAHERAEREDLEAVAPRVGERCRSEAAAEAASLALLVDLGVEERDPVVPAVVRGHANPAVAEAELVLGCLGDVDDLGIVRPCGDCFTLARLEVVDQLPDGVGLARRKVIEEPAPVLLGVLPRLELPEIAVDRARSAEEAAVFGLEGRDPVAAGGGLEGDSLFGPRLDLARDEVEPELREDLADGRGERAPLGLVEREQASALEAVRLVRAVAERLVGRAAAAAERGPLAFIEDVAGGVDDPHSSSYE
jgi:hypothetical protein